MEKRTAHDRILDFLFSFIAGIALAAAIVVIVFAVKTFAPDRERVGFVFAVVFLPLLFQVFGAFFLEAGLFHLRGNPSTLINSMHWVSGIFGIAAIFDVAMRLSRQTAWMMSGRAPFIVDAIFIVLFFLWMLTSHFINKSAAEKKECRYC